jgi:hypothetical protein
MSGLEMMLRSFGLDPEQIKTSMGETVAAIKTFDGRLQAIEKALRDLGRSVDSASSEVFGLAKICERMEGKLDGRDAAGPSNYEPGREYCVGCGATVDRCSCRGAARSNGLIVA